MRCKCNGSVGGLMVHVRQSLGKVWCSTLWSVPVNACVHTCLVSRTEPMFELFSFSVLLFFFFFFIFPSLFLLLLYFWLLPFEPPTKSDGWTAGPELLVWCIMYTERERERERESEGEAFAELQTNNLFESLCWIVCTGETLRARQCNWLLFLLPSLTRIEEEKTSRTRKKKCAIHSIHHQIPRTIFHLFF